MRRGYGWRVPAGGEARIGVGSYDPYQHVRRPTDALAARVGAPAVRYQGNWFPHRLRAATDGDVFYVGDSAGHCFPLRGRASARPSTSGSRAGASCGGAGRRRRPASAPRALRGLPRRPRAGLPPRAAPPAGAARAAAAAADRRAARPAAPAIVDRAFGWYLDQAHPPSRADRARPSRPTPCGGAGAPARRDGDVLYVGDSAGHCFPLSGEGIRTAFYFGIAAGRALRAVLAGTKTRERAFADYAAFHDAHAAAFRRALRLQRLVPALPPRVLTIVLRALGSQRLVDRAFGWYLEQAHPRFAQAMPASD